MNTDNNDNNEDLDFFEDSSVSTLVDDSVPPADAALEQSPEDSDEPVDSVNSLESEPTNQDDIRNAIKEGFQSLQQPKENPNEDLQKKAEEYIESLKANYSVEDLKALGLIQDDDEADLADNRLKAFNDVLQRKQQENLAYTQLLLDQQKRELEERVNPYVAYVQEQQKKEIQESFFNKYESLKPYQNIVDLVTKQMIDEKSPELQGASSDKVFEAVATKTADYIKEFGNKDFQLSVNQKSHKKEIRKAVEGMPKPAEMTTGGRNQTNPSSESGANDSDWVDDLTTAII